MEQSGLFAVRLHRVFHLPVVALFLAQLFHNPSFFLATWFEIKRATSAVHLLFSVPLFPFTMWQCFTLLPPCGVEEQFELLSLVWCSSFILEKSPIVCTDSAARSRRDGFQFYSYFNEILMAFLFFSTYK